MEKLSALTESLQRQLAGTESVTREQVSEWMKLYPYFSLPLMLYLRQNGKDDTQAVQLASAYASDLTHLATCIGRNEDFADLYPSAPTLQEKSTNDTIELFLQTYGNNEPMADDWLLSDNSSDENSDLQEATTLTPDAPDSTSKDNEVTPSIMPAYDYISTVEAMPDAEGSAPLQGEELLSRFIEADEAGEQLFSRPSIPASSPRILPQNTAPVHNEEEKETLFTESLAKIYIRQRRYAKALEIIRRLSLNNPEKNVYFADQIRFLEKLIINIKN